MPGVLMEPLQDEFEWSVTTISAAVAVNMALYGLTAPFAATLMERGLFDIAGTIASGWLTDRYDPRVLLLVYYVLRGVSLAALPALFGPDIQLNMLAFIIF